MSFASAGSGWAGEAEFEDHVEENELDCERGVLSSYGDYSRVMGTEPAEISGEMELKLA